MRLQTTSSCHFSLPFFYVRAIKMKMGEIIDFMLPTDFLILLFMPALTSVLLCVERKILK